MQTIPFSKYQGTGNDFIIIDNTSAQYQLSQNQIRFFCDRKFGVGSDGLMLISPPIEEGTHFHLWFYNPDGSQSFCGNGSRCGVAFAQKLHLVEEVARFTAHDGFHHATIQTNGQVALQMSDVGPAIHYAEGLFLQTGSPHLVIQVQEIDRFDVFNTGRNLRYDARFSPGGTNVNFYEVLEPGKIKVRTYERGVENETLSCGTGVTAAAIAAHQEYNWETSAVEVTTPGGQLQVSFQSAQATGHYKEVILKGPAEPVFTGTIVV
ncbi:MAG TPA: diaminopimelate epimerase [Luteibaculaceae bacterium]|nr:diaminopimelate epimerase [Luteibaculaceae bacterium]